MWHCAWKVHVHHPEGIDRNGVVPRRLKHAMRRHRHARHHAAGVALVAAVNVLPILWFHVELGRAARIQCARRQYVHQLVLHVGREISSSLHRLRRRDELLLLE
jgi:hypothetical protein